jgi:hypothetical protein
MAIHILADGKNRFICGLFWQSLSRPRDLRSDAIALAKKINFDLMVLRKDQATAQAGYANAQEGAQRGMISLAATVASKIAADGAYYDGRQQSAQNWLGAFRLADASWAYFAVRDGNFLPNGDFAGPREKVLERLHRDYGLGGWNVVIGEPELDDQGFHNFNAKRIEDLIPRKRNGKLLPSSEHSLRPVTRKMPWKLAAALGMGSALAGVAGFMAWNQYALKQEEQARAIEATRRQHSAKDTVQEAPHPWPAKPLPAAMASACRPDLVSMSAGGWRLDEYRCTAGQILYSWFRGSSNVGYLLEQLPQAVVDLTGDKASYSTQHALPTGKDEELASAKPLIASLLSGFQLLGMTPRIALAPLAPPQQPLLPGMQAKDVPKPTWQTYSLSVNTGGMAPTEVLPVLAQPGIRLEQITYRAGEWLIEGVIYAK